MLFNSVSFLFFFPTVVVGYFLLPQRLRWTLLVSASAYFYMAFVPWYILILLFLIVLDYTLGRLLEREDGIRRKALLVASIVGNLGILFVFKYFNFFNENAAILAEAIGWNYSVESLKFILPIGLSFHVFQSLSYVIEVYRGRQVAERHLGIYALYVLYFPQLVAGPIERPQHLLPQLHGFHSFNKERIMDGLTLMLWGFFKKLVIADQLAVVVDQVYGNLAGAHPTAIVIAVVLFAYQLYCDFSGYSDIAVGASRVFGIELMKNFDRPFASRSIAEFWRRWHISLSTWLRDYLFTPLAFAWRHYGVSGSHAALFVTFVLIGFWHGAGWTYIMLGVTHGTYLVFGQATKVWRVALMERLGSARFPRFFKSIQLVITFALVALSLVFFRAQNMDDALHVIGSVIPGLLGFLDAHILREQVFTMAAIGITPAFLILRFLAIAFMEFVERSASRFTTIRQMLLGWAPEYRLAAYYLIALWMFLLGHFDAKSFIYFQF